MFQGIYHEKATHQPDLEIVLRRSLDSGVQRIMVTATSLQDCRDALELCQQYEGSFPGMLRTTLGVHPTTCNEFLSHPATAGGFDGYFSELQHLLSSKIGKQFIVALGEFGLDYARLEYCPAEMQKRFFRYQFKLLETRPDLPLFLHLRDAANDFIEIVCEHRHLFDKGVVHSFTGTLEEAQRLISLDLFIGLNGW